MVEDARDMVTMLPIVESRGEHAIADFSIAA